MMPSSRQSKRMDSVAIRARGVSWSQAVSKLVLYIYEVVVQQKLAWRMEWTEGGDLLV
jgi:hypothetical protein